MTAHEQPDIKFLADDLQEVLYTPDQIEVDGVQNG